MPQPSISVNILRDNGGNYYLPNGAPGTVHTFCTLPSGMKVLNNLLTVFLNPINGSELATYQPGAIIASKIINECDLSYVIAKESIYKIQFLLNKGCKTIVTIRPTAIFSASIESGIVYLNANKSSVTGTAIYHYKIYYSNHFGLPLVIILGGSTSLNSFNLSSLTNWNGRVFKIELTVTDSVGTGKASYDYVPTDTGGSFIGLLTNGCKDIFSLGDFNEDFNKDFF